MNKKFSKAKIWERDLEKILKKLYKKANAIFPESPDIALIDLIEWMMRIPSEIPRKIYKSKELERKILTPFEMKNLSEIEKVIFYGANLGPYLGGASRAIRNRKSKNNDLFFADWGLLHLHLGADFENKRIKVSRTGRVLIARILPDKAYLIDIVNHGRGYSDVWGDVSHLKILYENWPDSLGSSVSGEMVMDKDGREISSSEYIKLRNAGINVPVFVCGKTFISPNFGIAADGSNVGAVDISFKIMEELEKAEEILKEKELATEDIFLAVKKDFSVGFLVPSKNIFYCIYQCKDGSRVVDFFANVLSKIPLATDKRYSDYITPKRIKN